jgi:hypothetical protein
VVLEKGKPGRPKKYSETPVKFNLSFNPVLKQRVIIEANNKNISANKLVMDAINYYFKHYTGEEETIEKDVWNMYQFFKDARETGLRYIDDLIIEELNQFYQQVNDENIPECKRMIVQNMLVKIGKYPHELFGFERFNKTFKKLEIYVKGQ